MLDSTGLHDTKKISCFVCEGNALEFPTYTPQVGHSGEQLNIGTCIERRDSVRSDRFKNWDGATFFEIKAVPKNSEELYEWVRFEAFQPIHSGSGYHYHGWLLPDFGTNVGQVVYVCASCKSGYDGVPLRDFDLQQAFGREMNKKGEDILVRMIIDAKLWQFLPKLASKAKGEARKNLQEQVEKLMRNLRASNSKRASFGLRNYGAIEKALR